MKKDLIPIWLRYLLLISAGVSVILGLYAALRLLGFLHGYPASYLAQSHGALMVFGFVGGAIALERAVAVRTKWALLAPLASALGVLSIIMGCPLVVSSVLWGVSFCVLIAIYLVIQRRGFSISVTVQTIGAVGGLFATVLWGLSGEFEHCLAFACVYVVATIIGERMELARVSFAGSNAEDLITLLVLLLFASAITQVVAPTIGTIFLGLCLIAVSVATLRVDVARRLVKSSGLPQFSAICMVAGYVWLILAGIVWIFSPVLKSTYTYDVKIHTIFLGFVISMIFAHAPIILTAVLKRQLPYSPLMYIPVVLLHVGLLIRVGVGAPGALLIPWQIGGVVSVLAILLFIVLSVFFTVRAASKKKACRRKTTQESLSQESEAAR